MLGCNRRGHSKQAAGIDVEGEGSPSTCSDLTWALEAHGRTRGSLDELASPATSTLRSTRTATSLSIRKGDMNGAPQRTDASTMSTSSTQLSRQMPIDEDKLGSADNSKSIHTHIRRHPSALSGTPAKTAAATAGASWPTYGGTAIATLRWVPAPFLSIRRGISRRGGEVRQHGFAPRVRSRNFDPPVQQTGRRT
jgi:hypothetical protein